MRDHFRNLVHTLGTVGVYHEDVASGEQVVATKMRNSQALPHNKWK